MKKKTNKLLICLLSFIVLASLFSFPAFADPGDYYPYELPPNPNPDVIYPEGNMTIVSDVTGEAANQKEFLTVTTKDGNYFYIIIDRSADGENTVHFLNKVDESDLHSLMSEKEVEAYQQSLQPVATPTPTPVPVATPTPTAAPTQDNNGSDLAARATILLVLIAALAVLVIFYLRKNHRKSDSGSLNLDDLDIDDDEEEYFEAEKYTLEEDET
mgnify:CR=1 FL=1